MKKIILLIPLIFSLYLVQILNPKDISTNNIETIKTTISDLNIDNVKNSVYKFFNEQWFVVTSSISGFNVAIRDNEKPPVHITITKTPQYNELYKIADKIDYNETRGIAANRVHWNVGENFASMGIGHFIWYPKGYRHKEFSEQFPDMIRYLSGIGLDVPKRLLRQINKGAYWNSREELNNSRNSKEYKEVLKFLSETKIQQAQFIQNKFMLDLLRLYSISNRRDMNYMNKQIKRISSRPGGWYVLIDYTNFKGIGGTPNRKYNNVDWGLKQVILNMKRYRTQDVLLAFSKSAKYTLSQRVKNSPKSRREQENKWLQGGWSSRVKEYRNPYI
jgi:hypothetical protein